MSRVAHHPRAIMCVQLLWLWLLCANAGADAVGVVAAVACEPHSVVTRLCLLLYWGCLRLHVAQHGEHAFDP